MDRNRIMSKSNPFVVRDSTKIFNSKIYGRVEKQININDI